MRRVINSRIISPRAAAIAAVIALPVLPLSALGAPVVKETVTYYEIGGSKASDVRAQMALLGPFYKRDGLRYGAMTHWNVNWRFTYRKVGANCAFETVATTLDIAFNMPRLKTADQDLKTAFSRFYSNLETHERGHANHGLEAAWRIESAFLSMLPNASCEVLGSAANERGRAILDEANQKDLEYDSVTGHGRTQGAYLP